MCGFQTAGEAETEATINDLTNDLLALVLTLLSSTRRSLTPAGKSGMMMRSPWIQMQEQPQQHLLAVFLISLPSTFAKTATQRPKSARVVDGQQPPLPLCCHAYVSSIFDILVLKLYSVSSTLPQWWSSTYRRIQDQSVVFPTLPCLEEIHVRLSASISVYLTHCGRPASHP